MPKIIDLSGRKFGRLTALCRGGSKGGRPSWICECECGNVKEFRGGDLRSGESQSCGCYRNDQVRASIEVHGNARRSGKLPEYNVWCSMRQRCLNPKSHDWKYYGGRGISVCERWDSYPSFIKDMGRRPSPKHTIERINNDGNYEPKNCKWATWSEQRRNTRKFK